MGTNHTKNVNLLKMRFFTSICSRLALFVSATSSVDDDPNTVGVLIIINAPRKKIIYWNLFIVLLAIASIFGSNLF